MLPMAEVPCKWPGSITRSRPAFAEVSGFDEAELIGLPHNIVRPHSLISASRRARPTGQTGHTRDDANSPAMSTV